MRNRTVIWKAVGRTRRGDHRRRLLGIPARTQHHADLHPACRVPEQRRQHVINTDIPGPSLTEEGQARPSSSPTSSPATTSTPSTPPTWSAPSRPLSRWPTRSARASKSCPVCAKSTPAGTTTRTTKRADLTYLLAPADWLNGDVKDAVPGSISGNEFNDQFTAAVQKIYDSGNSKPVAFSHAESIMYWTLMNVKNPKDSLATSHPLPNLGRVVITGSPATGWTLVDWDGIRDFSY